MKREFKWRYIKVYKKINQILSGARSVRQSLIRTKLRILFYIKHFLFLNKGLKETKHDFPNE